MRTLINGKWVVGFEGGRHSLHRDFQVVYEQGRIVYVGPKFEGRVDARSTPPTSSSRRVSSTPMSIPAIAPLTG